MRPPKLTAFDDVALAAGGLGVIAAFALVFAGQPRFAEMFHELGGTLPAVTRLCLQPWFPPLVACVPLGIAALGLRLRRGSLLRMVLVLVLSLSWPAAWLGAMYLPLFTLSSAIE